MLYEIAHIIKNRFLFLWKVVEWGNATLFYLMHKKKLMEINSVLEQVSNVYRFRTTTEEDVKKLVDFFARQPEEAFEFFKPHGFDVKSIKELQRNKAFLAYVLLDGHQISGYCFNRSFFHGKGFRGRMVDIDYRGMGLGIMMNRILNKVGFGIGLRVFETVNKDNIASYRSAMSANNVRILEELDGKDLYLEILKV